MYSFSAVYGVITTIALILSNYLNFTLYKYYLNSEFYYVEKRDSLDYFKLLISNQTDVLNKFNDLSLFIFIIVLSSLISALYLISLSRRI